MHKGGVMEISLARLMMALLLSSSGKSMRKNLVHQFQRMKRVI